jgi:hypothetical protein
MGGSESCVTERLGIKSSLIRPHYELPIPVVASSRKKKSRQGITIRENKQPVSTVEGSSSHYYIELSLKQRKVSVYYDTLLSRQ